MKTKRKLLAASMAPPALQQVQSPMTATPLPKKRRLMQIQTGMDNNGSMPKPAPSLPGTPCSSAADRAASSRRDAEELAVDADDGDDGGDAAGWGEEEDGEEEELEVDREEDGEEIAESWALGEEEDEDLEDAHNGALNAEGAPTGKGAGNGCGKGSKGELKRDAGLAAETASAPTKVPKKTASMICQICKCRSNEEALCAN